MFALRFIWFWVHFIIVMVVVLLSIPFALVLMLFGTIGKVTSMPKYIQLPIIRCIGYYGLWVFQCFKNIALCSYDKNKLLVENLIKSIDKQIEQMNELLEEVK